MRASRAKVKKAKSIVQHHFCSTVLVIFLECSIFMSVLTAFACCVLCGCVPSKKSFSYLCESLSQARIDYKRVN